MNTPSIILKAGKEKPVLNKHHWIFSGAIAKIDNCQNGDFCSVYSHQSQLLGSCYVNRKSGIVGRMLTFDDTPPLQALEQSLESAVSYRQELFDENITNGYRLINGEGDNLPGLVVDRYADTLVMQIATVGMEKLKGHICQWLQKRLNIENIYEKSNLPTRKEEGLQPFSGLLSGALPASPVAIVENGLHFAVDIVNGQKTGFFCDHREMREKIRAMAAGKRVLNCFSYSGGFSVYALAGGAASVDTVDLSAQAIEWAKTNCALNGFAQDNGGFHVADVFNYLREMPLDHDIVILDPPAFAKRQKDIMAACRGYKEINRVAMQKMRKGTWLLSCSCSHYVDEELFQKVLFQAAVEANRTVRIAGKHILAQDHPVNICHPESSYLKSFLLYVT